jgi:alkylhydroperoxidase/carboxymuconolactone decarboxylase family protein YurZ
LVESVNDHFMRTLGNVPAPIAVLRDNLPDYLEGYLAMRKALLADHDGGLDLAMKELIFVLLDVVYDNESGALNHLDAGLRAGLQPVAVLEALLQAMVVGGIATWGKSGHRVFAAALERHEAAASA